VPASGFDSSAKSGGAIPEPPIFFSKVPESVIGTGATVEMPAASTAIDYEAELTVISSGCWARRLGPRPDF
jgi:2-keto-4-pentenoate hydratase/2-oxohepta-3-ene-1,7-dioic acid hydratase in catechol pathway